LKDEDINQNLKYEGLEVEILDFFYKHPDLEVFKKNSCESFADTVKFFLTQIELP
jgi:hypothetical protein